MMLVYGGEEGGKERRMRRRVTMEGEGDSDRKGK
jgi:hypothetical protein